jgi:preprotein translocase subunit SecG
MCPFCQATDLCPRGVFDFPKMSVFFDLSPQSHSVFLLPLRVLILVVLVDHVSTSEMTSLSSGGSERLLAQPCSGRSFITVSTAVEVVLSVFWFVLFLSRFYNKGERKSKFKDEIKSKYSCFRNGR